MLQHVVWLRVREMVHLPDSAHDLPEMGEVAQSVRLAKEVLEEEDEVLLVFDEDGVLDPLAVAELAVQELGGLDQLAVLLQQLLFARFLNSK